MPPDESPPTPNPLKIAFTYDSCSDWIARGYSPGQCAEFQDDATIEGIAASLRKLGTVEMVGGVKSLAKRLVSSQPDWDLVFNFCEGYGTLGREAQVPALLEAWGIPFTFSDSATLALCMDKAKTKVSKQQSAGLEMNEIDYPHSPHCDSLDSYPLFVKPASVSTGIGISRINKVHDREQLAHIVEEITKQYPTQTVLIERFLGGREFTVGIIGTGTASYVIGVRELHKWSQNPQYVDMDLSDDIAHAAGEVALKAWKLLECRDGGRVDIRHDKMGLGAVPNFIEVNPLAGLTPNWSDLPELAKANGTNFDRLLELMISSALKRRI
ncbi:hypothetical protein M413DRAFT_419468 [Hebeloma cylindrosporum]|uniref:ATP-grasp domain-containing protein n=1 Tax=Hebeloma cylindrosporum TaxID=76867 RepID=A0A0C3C5Z9_HEBCY|nr:hypothetical protein M413DRAFT_419468 [Hebeloma cylindrosporum h7]